MAAIVLFALSGELPFGGGDATTVVGRQLGRQAVVDPYPAPLREWLRRALEPEPDRRFIDAAEMQRAWRQMLAALRGRPSRGWLVRALAVFRPDSREPRV